MPGELGQILPTTDTIALPKLEKTVTPDWEIRSISRPLISANELEPALRPKHGTKIYAVATHGSLSSELSGAALQGPAHLPITSQV